MMKRIVRSLITGVLRVVAGVVGGLALLLLPWALLAFGVYLTVHPEVVGVQMRGIIAAVAAGLALTCAAVATVQARTELDGVTTTTETADGSQKSQIRTTRRGNVVMVRGYAGRIVDATTGTTLRAAGAVIAPLTALLGGTAAGVAPGLWSYPVAVVLGPLAAFTLARKAGAARKVNLSGREAYRIFSLYGWPILPAVVAAAAAVGLWAVGVWFGAPSLALLAYLVVTAAGTALGYRTVSALRVETEDRAALLAPLSLALGATEAEMDALHWRITPDGHITITGRIPATVLRNRGKYEDLFAEHMPTYEVEEVTEHGITVSPVTEEKRTQRETLAATRGLVLTVETLNPEEMY